MGRPSDGLMAAVSVSCLVAAALIGLTAGYCDSQWEARLVDDPAGIAAVRSRVLAERAEAAAK